MADISLNNLLKVRYLKEAQTAIPDLAVLQSEIVFNHAAELGQKVTVPVILRRSGAFVHGASGPMMTTIAGRGFETGVAEIIASQMGIQEAISSSDAQRASSGEKAFDLWAKQILTPSMMSFKSRLEHYLLNGGYAGTVTAVTGSGPWVITLANTFADAVWAGQENTSYVDIFSAMTAGTTRGTSLQVTAVDYDNKQITVAGTATGIAANDVVFFEGTRGVLAPSLREQLANTTGTMLNINASTYSLWKPTQHQIATTGLLTMAETLKAVAKAVGRGGLSEDCMLICSPSTIQNLSQDQSALRTYDASYKGGKAETGFAGVRYKAAAGFSVDVMAHPLCLPNEAFIISKSGVGRYGSCDVTMGGAMTGGTKVEPVFNHPSGFGLAYRLFTEQAIAVLNPAQCVRITNASGTVI